MLQASKPFFDIAQTSNKQETSVDLGLTPATGRGKKRWFLTSAIFSFFSCQVGY